jgi:hypothetical protein
MPDPVLYDSVANAITAPVFNNKAKVSGLPQSAAHMRTSRFLAASLALQRIYFIISDEPIEHLFRAHGDSCMRELVDEDNLCSIVSVNINVPF